MLCPAVPLTLAADEEMSSLHAWVIQTNGDGTGAVCVASQEAGGFRARDRWSTRDDTAVHEGRFQPGQAFAMAVSISRNAKAMNGPPVVYWWGETIGLKAADDHGILPGGKGAQGRLIDLLEEALQILRGGGGAAGDAARQPGNWR